MTLQPMRYKNFIWPHNPESYSIGFARRMAARAVPNGPVHMQGLGMDYRVMRGRGAFFGPEAYDTFKQLATVFYENTPGLLTHPVWQSANAWFVSLSLAQEPERSYVAYEFSFWEDRGLYKPSLATVNTVTAAPAAAPQAAPAASPAYYTVKKGDTLWAIAKAHNLELSALIALNPQIKNPNLIYVGDRVRVK